MNDDEPDDDQAEDAEVIDMNQLIRNTAANTSAPYMNWADGAIHDTNEPITDNPPPDAA